MVKSHREDIEKINNIIHNSILAEAIYKSVESGINNRHVCIMGKTVWDVFKHSLDAAIRDIETHPRGKLFQRFLEYGPLNPDEPEKLSSDGETILSDPECGKCVQFIFSHMINRFKGELAELLAIGPCLELIRHMQAEGRWSGEVELYLGETIQERRQIKTGDKMRWGEFVKGADGLIVEKPSGQEDRLKICGIVEVKSMVRSASKLSDQLQHHLDRLAGGLRLENITWNEEQIFREATVYVMVLPSTWRLNRKCYSQDNQLIYPESNDPPVSTKAEEIRENRWKITLDWSKEALEQAAYEMTYWYMSQVGTAIYKEKPLPKEWEHMTAEEAGYNSIKMMLYYVMLRYITPQQGKCATRLYNAYSFGYPLAMDSKEMLWPDDIPHQDKG